MAKITASPAAQAALLLSLTTLAACSFGDKSAPVALGAAQPTTAVDRFSQEDSYTVAVPRRPDLGAAIDPNAPESYTVVRGDTLWDISDRFLKHAWLWPQLWDYNPQIKNPHLIYPGDLVGLEYVDGQPRLVVERDGERVSQSGGSENGNYTERLSPRIRSESLNDAIPMIPGDAIASFLCCWQL